MTSLVNDMQHHFFLTHPTSPCFLLPQSTVPVSTQAGRDLYDWCCHLQAQLLRTLHTPGWHFKTGGGGGIQDACLTQAKSILTSKERNGGMVACSGSDVSLLLFCCLFLQCLDLILPSSTVKANQFVRCPERMFFPDGRSLKMECCGSYLLFFFRKA